MKPTSRKPLLLIVAGPNGAGKTTFTKSCIQGFPVVNPDVIAAEIDKSRIDDPQIQRQAGAIALIMRDAFLQEKKSFAIETTLSGKGEKKLVEQAKLQGYAVVMYYIGVDGPHVSMKRVESRVKNGGHHVPGKDVARRYYRSLENLAVILPLIDKAVILDNSSKLRKIVVSLHQGQVQKQYAGYPRWLNSAGLKEMQAKIRKNRI